MTTLDTERRIAATHKALKRDWGANHAHYSGIMSKGLEAGGKSLKDKLVRRGSLVAIPNASRESYEVADTSTANALLQMGFEATGTARHTNPYAESSFNVTEQARLVREDPERAKRLAAQAGYKGRMVPA